MSSWFVFKIAVPRITMKGVKGRNERFLGQLVGIEAVMVK